MAAPAEITLKNLDGQWVMNRTLSSNYDAILKLQGVNWLMRKVMNMASVILTVKQWVGDDGVTRLTIENKPSSGLPGSTEQRVFDFAGSEIAHPLFGKIRGRSRWVRAAELDEIDPFLARGFESGLVEFAHFQTDHLDHGAVTHQVLGFEEIEGTRFHTRHVVVKKGEEVLQVRLVYDYIGPRPAES